MQTLLSQILLSLIIFSQIVLLFSCAPKSQPVSFPVQGTRQILYGLGPEAAQGRTDFAKTKKLEYRFEAPVTVTSPASLEIEYSLTQGRAVFEAGTHSWVLPRWEDLGDHGFGGVIHYAIPVNESFPENFSITVTAGTQDSVLQIRSINFIERRYGFDRFLEKQIDHIYVSPYVSRRNSDSAWVIDPPAEYSVPTDYYTVLSAWLRQGNEAILETGKRRLEVSPYLEYFTVPPGIIAPGRNPVVFIGDRVVSFRLAYAALPLFPQPIISDPGMILEWPEESWRDRRYELFCWENFPSLLIFDFIDYAMQDRMLKRLAFFTEKAGYRGRLASDDEIADQHGWNAHDYRAQDLAMFFQAARESNFPLLHEERELERILINAKIIQESGAGLQAGEGGIISLSRESSDYLRRRFMAHEGYHGLFFIDEDFRTFSRRRWQALGPEARRFIVSFFNYQRYDTADEYLLVNEFMAHIMQQPKSQAGSYFGQYLPSRLEESSWRKYDLPEKDTASGTWPALTAAFSREAQIFSDYAETRWGLSAGTVNLVSVNSK